MLRKGLVGAALGVLALGSIAFADDSSATPSPAANATQVSVFNGTPDWEQPLFPVVYGDDQPPPPAPAPATPTPAVPAPAAATPPPPPPSPEVAPPAPQGAIMWGLDQIPGFADANQNYLHLNIAGYVEMGYFYDMTVPRDVSPARSTPSDLVLFPGDYKNDLMLNQVDLAISRTVQNDRWDIGFDIEALYGRDAVYVHSNGILDSANKRGATSPDDDLDLEQAYLTFNIPLGAGIVITAGKFDTLLGNETINPTTNLFYTHSYIFSYGIPFTQTGITASYKFCDSLSATAGLSRGWNQTLYDNNSAIDFLGQVVWTPNSRWSVTLNLSEGPESTHNDSDYWTVPEAIVSWQVADQLKVSFDVLYGDASSIAQWYGAAAYASYSFDQYVALNLRGEFYDEGHATGPGGGQVGFTTGVASAHDVNYVEGTIGLGITPLPNIKLAQSLTVRPEVRVDLADQPVFDGTKWNQVTAAIDAYWKF